MYKFSQLEWIPWLIFNFYICKIEIPMLLIRNMIHFYHASKSSHDFVYDVNIQHYVLYLVKCFLLKAIQNQSNLNAKIFRKWIKVLEWIFFSFFKAYYIVFSFLIFFIILGLRLKTPDYSPTFSGDKVSRWNLVLWVHYK